MVVTAAPTLDVLLATNGDAPGRRVDAIVCDYRLAAGRLGTDAIASIRARLGYAPRAVLITGDVDVDALRRAPGEHTSVLAKPFGPSPLAHRLLACIGAGPSPIGA
jgi:CheY-like chemotaxis protein